MSLIIVLILSAHDGLQAQRGALTTAGRGRRNW